MNKFKLIFLFSMLVLITFKTTELLGKVKIEIDYAIFHYDSTQSLAEIYYAIPMAELKFIDKQSNSLHAQAMIQLTVNKENNYFSDYTWKLEKSIKDTSELRDSGQMVDVLKYLMQPGLYEFSLYIEDLNDSTNTDTKNIEVDIDLYSEKDVGLSDIQFASSIKQEKMDKNNVFWKSGLEIVPNPGAVYSSRTPVLFYYLESYNLEKLLKSDNYKNKAYITSTDGNVIERIKPRVQQKKALNSSIEVGTINISSLPSGVYNFNFEIYDMNDRLRRSADKKFYVYSPLIDAESEVGVEDFEKGFVESEFAEMNEKELDNEFELIRYFLTNEQRGFYKKLDNAEAKRRLIYEIWQKMDPTPNTRINEFKIQYKQRIEEANEEFRSYTRKGWKTDRGRVYVLYGAPTDVERYPNNPTSFAHEIWHYDNIEGGIIFVFVDLQEFGEYIQIHSTKRGEPMNNNWEEMIDKHIR